MEYGFKVTTHGRAMLTACTVLGIQPKLTRAAVGSGKVDETENLADIHQLIQYEDEGTVGERYHEGDHFYLTVQYSNKDRVAGAFSLNEFMVFMEDPATGQETDFLYATLGDYPQGIPGCSDALPIGVWEFPLVIVVSNELKIEVSASPGLVTWDGLARAIAAHDGDPNAHPYIRGLCADLDARLGLMELMYATDVNGNPFTVTFGTLDGLTVTGVWNQAQARLEF